MERIVIEKRENIALVKLSRGTTNAIDLELVKDLREAVRSVTEDSNSIGMILTSSNSKFFAIGFDIPALFDLPRDEFSIFLKQFDRLCLDLYTMSKPVVAAITGHATAGGCILTLCCDYRYIIDGRKLMGLNEIKLGVQIPYPADRILDQLVGYRKAREIVDSGDFFEPGESLALGLVDEIVPEQELMDKAAEKVQSLVFRAPAAFARIKQDRTETTAHLIEVRLNEKEELFLDLWFSEQARARLKEAMERF